MGRLPSGVRLRDFHRASMTESNKYAQLGSTADEEDPPGFWDVKLTVAHTAELLQ